VAPRAHTGRRDHCRTTEDISRALRSLLFAGRPRLCAACRHRPAGPLLYQHIAARGVCDLSARAPSSTFSVAALEYQLLPQCLTQTIRRKTSLQGLIPACARDSSLRWIREALLRCLLVHRGAGGCGWTCTGAAHERRDEVSAESLPLIANDELGHSGTPGSRSNVSRAAAGQRLAVEGLPSVRLQLSRIYVFFAAVAARLSFDQNLNPTRREVDCGLSPSGPQASTASAHAAIGTAFSRSILERRIAGCAGRHRPSRRRLEPGWQTLAVGEGRRCALRRNTARTLYFVAPRA